MIKIHCRTNLDLDCREQFPTELPELPRINDLIESAHEWIINNEGTIGHGSKVHLKLQVVSITWKYIRSYNIKTIAGSNEWFPYIELHLPPHRYQNLEKFYEYYGRITGRGKHAFI